MKIKLKDLRKIVKETVTEMSGQSEYSNDQELNELRDVLTGAFESIRHFNEE